MSVKRIGGAPLTLLGQWREAGARIAELEAERDRLKSTLESMALACVEGDANEAYHLFYTDCIGGDWMLPAEIQSTRTRMGVNNAIAKRETLRRENILLRKALQDAPHDPYCASKGYREDRDESGMVTRVHAGLPCTCWKAALARIPEAKPPHE